MSIAGHCPICGNDVEYEERGPWHRDQLWCPACPGGSVPRERALALVLNEIRPAWRDLRIHESSPCGRGISVVMTRECPQYTASQFYPDRPFGEIVNGARNENLEAQTFADAAFDIVVSLDVMEHIYNPDKALGEIYRTLSDGGVYICTFPVRKAQVEQA
ncbi:MAG: class I SAM-dependent methyltransferase, partial [Alphaproteobacteria bacterium]|nr:class I SAM-dependent methyltransferase [Alphaproteobacteria bacterium]